MIKSGKNKILVYSSVIGVVLFFSIIMVGQKSMREKSEALMNKNNTKTTVEITNNTNESLQTNNDKVMVTFIDDDGTKNFLTKWKPVADVKKIKISLGIVKDFVGTNNYMTLDEIKKIRDEGFDILSHSKTHPQMINITEAAWEAECKESLQFIRDNSFNDKAIVYPFGISDVTDKDKSSKLKQTTSKYYKYAIDSRDSTNAIPITDNMQIQRVKFDGADLDLMKNVVDKAFSRKHWLVILTHSGYATNTELYDDIIDYIKSKDMDIVTFNEAVERLNKK